MLRWLLIALALAFGVHHTALAAAAPATAHAHHGACADCGAAHSGHDDETGVVLAACAALLAAALAVPGVRRHLVRLTARTVRPTSGADPGHPLTARPPPPQPAPVRLCVLRC